jgi:hypothetical protein
VRDGEVREMGCASGKGAQSANRMGVWVLKVLTTGDKGRQGTTKRRNRRQKTHNNGNDQIPSSDPSKEQVGG